MANATPGNRIRVGVIADQTGPLSFVGQANANVARMVIGDINAKGGLLGRQLELILEDSATNDAVAAAVAAKLIEQDRVDVVFGGIYSSTRQAIKEPVVTKGRTLYIYPEQYEGQEAHPLIFCTGPVPAQQVEPFVPWLMQQTGATRFYLPSADYIWPRVMNTKVREVVTALGGSIVGEEYFPVDHTDYRATVEKITASKADVVFNMTVPPGVSSFLEQLHASGFAARGGQLVCTYFDENFLNMVPAPLVEGLYSCLDYYQGIDDPFSKKLLAQYDALYPGAAKFTAGSACSGLYRGFRLWAAAVTEAGTLAQADVIAAFDHAQIAEGPGGPAAMVPGQHHARLNMYIAQAHGGRFKLVKSLGPSIRTNSWSAPASEDASRCRRVWETTPASQRRGVSLPAPTVRAFKENLIHRLPIVLSAQPPSSQQRPARGSLSRPSRPLRRCGWALLDQEAAARADDPQAQSAMHYGRRQLVMAKGDAAGVKAHFDQCSGEDPFCKAERVTAAERLGDAATAAAAREQLLKVYERDPNHLLVRLRMTPARSS
jgi:branched-chain amino acid transport system substrate-binding protein